MCYKFQANIEAERLISIKKKTSIPKLELNVFSFVIGDANKKMNPSMPSIASDCTI